MPDEPRGPDDAPIVVEVAGEEPVVAWPLLLRRRLAGGAVGPGPSPAWVLVTVLTGLFATGFTITILGVSLGTIAADLGSDTPTLTWVVTGPLLAVALAMPLCGKLGDVYGHRRVYLVAMAGFTVSAALTALAWDAGSLIALRVVGALAGAAAGPSSMALIMDAFPERDRVKAMGWWSLVGAGAPVIGLVAGGPAVEALGWRLIFVAQAPISAAAVGAAFLVLRETPRQAREPIDWTGALLLAGASVSGLMALNRAPSWGWASPAVIGLFVLAPALLAAFVWCERRADHPVLPLAFFRRRNFTASLVAQFGSNFAYMGGFIVTPLLLQSVFGWSLAAASLAMVVRPLTFSASSPAGGYVAVRVGERRASLFGTALVLASMAVFVGAAAGTTTALVFAGLALSGLGLGAAQPSMVSLLANTVDNAQLGVASAAQQMVTTIGVVAGIQVMSTVQGGASSAGSFSGAYAVGAVLAAVGLLGALGLERDQRPATLRVVRAA